jgi:methylated-DNA-[protein]-cysteine S-methyltransferase
MSTLQAVRVIGSPIGNIAIGCTEVGLSQLEILPTSNRRVEFSHNPQAERLCEKVAVQLDQYFQGLRSGFTLTLDLAGSSFQSQVWEVVAQTEFGQSISYGEIASRIGKPAAARAVGGAVGANPVPIVIGCHRVLGAGSAVTGYTGGEGIQTKLWLLAHEGIEYHS